MEEGVLLLRHEDLCVDPLTFFRRAAGHLQLSFNLLMERKIRSATSGGKVGYSNQKLHNFERNSRELAWSWLGKDVRGQDVIHDICRNLVERLYGGWRPHCC